MSAYPATCCFQTGRTYGSKCEWVDLNTEGSDILLFELSGQMTLDEGSLLILVRFELPRCYVCWTRRRRRGFRGMIDSEAGGQMAGSERHRVQKLISKTGIYRSSERGCKATEGPTCLSGSTVADKDKLEVGGSLSSCSFSHGSGVT